LQTVQFRRWYFQVKQQAQENNAFYIPSLAVVKKHILVSPAQKIPEHTLIHFLCKGPVQNVILILDKMQVQNELHLTLQCVSIPDFLLTTYLLVLELYTESCGYHPAQSEGLFSSCLMAVIAPLPNSNYSEGAVASTLAVSVHV
jgi:hypothetical protein